MPGYVNIIDSVTGQTANVNADRELSVALTADEDKAGLVKIISETSIPFASTEDGHMVISEDTVVFFDQVDGTAVNTNIWDASQVSGMTITQSGGFINLNAGASTTANAYCILKSIKSIPLYPEFPVFVAFDLKTNIQPLANATIEFGFGNPTGASAIQDGIFYRLAPDGTMRGITVNNGVETVTAALTNVTSDIMHDFDITIEVDDANFEIDDAQEAVVANPPGIPFSTGNTRLPLFIRIINGSSAPATAPRVSLGRISAIQKVLKPIRPWGETLALLGRGAYQSPVTPFAQTAQHANSTTPSAASLSNTVPSYNTFGGRFVINATAGAATDFALFSYQVPAGFQLVLTGVSVYSAVSTILGAAATILKWSLGVNSSGVSLATIDGAGTWAPRRVPIGIQGFTASAPVGTTGIPILLMFPTSAPMVIDSGRYLHLILQMPVGSTTGAFNGDAAFFGYFE